MLKCLTNVQVVGEEFWVHTEMGALCFKKVQALDVLGERLAIDGDPDFTLLTASRARVGARTRRQRRLRGDWAR